MESALEDVYKTDPFIQKKLKEIALLKSELASLQSPQPKSPKKSFSIHSPPKASIRKIPSAKNPLKKSTWSSLQKIFIKYSETSNYLNVHKLEHSVFLKFLEDCHLLNNNFTRVSADLLFYHNRKSNQIDIWGFIDILKKISQDIYGLPGENESLSKLVEENLVQALKIEEEIKRIEKFHNWFKDPDLQQIVAQRKTLLEILFNMFKSCDSADFAKVDRSLLVKVVGGKRMKVDRIGLKGFLSLLQTFEFMPDAISGLAAARVFRAVPSRVLFNECLDFDEFVEACFFTSIFVCEQESFRGMCSGFKEYFEFWFRFIDSHPRFLIENPNPLRNYVYDLSKFLI